MEMHEGLTEFEQARPGLARLIQFFDDRRIDQRIHLCPDRGWPPFRREGDLPVDLLAYLLAQAERRYHERVQFHRGHIAGDVVEQLRGIAPERSEERRVGNECVSTCRSGWAPDA